MRTTIRLMVKSLRFEIVAMSVAVILLGCVALYLAWRLGQVGIPHECLYSNSPFGEQYDATLDATCQAARDRFYELVNTGGQVLAMTVLIPCVAGLLIGVPLVARELESGTASLAWTLSRSRRSWYLRRVIPLAAIVGLALLLPAAATVIMQGARQPDVDPWASFSDGSLRGPVVLFRGLLAMGVGVLAGAVVGRQLPAVIIGGLLAILLISVVPIGVQAFSATLGEWRTAEQTTSGDLTLDASDTATRPPAPSSTTTPCWSGLPRCPTGTRTRPGSRRASTRWSSSCRGGATPRSPVSRAPPLADWPSSPSASAASSSAVAGPRSGVSPEWWELSEARVAPPGLRTNWGG